MSLTDFLFMKSPIGKTVSGSSSRLGIHEAFCFFIVPYTSPIVNTPKQKNAKEVPILFQTDFNTKYETIPIS